MTIRELIKELEMFDKDTLVMVRGYEGGVEDITEIADEKVDLNVNAEDWYGSHEVNRDGKTKAIVLR